MARKNSGYPQDRYYPDYPGPYVRPPQNRQPVPAYTPPVMSVGQWAGTLVLLLIPLVNVICFIVWLFGGGNNKTRTNWVRASLLIALIPLIIVLIFIFAFGGLAVITDLLDGIAMSA